MLMAGFVIAASRYGCKHLPTDASTIIGNERYVYPVLDWCYLANLTQSIIRGGETNYISATISLYVSIYNIFINLLSILGIMNSND